MGLEMETGELVATRMPALAAAAAVASAAPAPAFAVAMAPAVTAAGCPAGRKTGTGAGAAASVLPNFWALADAAAAAMRSRKSSGVRGDAMFASAV